VGDIFSHVGIGHSTLTPLQSTIVWTLRAPRMVLGLLAGAMLAVAGGTYQGVFRNPLADPYLLGVASGAGLGATFAIMDISHGGGTPTWTPLLAFAGAMAAVAVTWIIGGRSMRSNTATLILAGVAVAALLTSADISPATVERAVDHPGLHLAARFARQCRMELGGLGPSLRPGLHHHLRRRPDERST
jgi:ABC-type Fe3+-siderophore transport system permease subunit